MRSADSEMRTADQKRKLQVRIISVLMGLTLVFIWGHSMIPAVLSSMESSRFVDMINGLISAAGSSFYVTDHMVRKTAHFLEYAILGAETALRNKWKYTVSADGPEKQFEVVLFWIGVPVIDELIQHFTPGRACMIRDVILDMAGFSAGYGLVWIISLCADRNLSAHK